MQKKHGLYKTRIYKIYKQMKQRCYNPKRDSYKNYGGRGIKICDEWNNDFLCFYNWSLSNGYSDSFSIDRIDVNGNYCPENCRWADRKTQANNKRTSQNIYYNNKTYTIATFAEAIGIDKRTMWSRFHAAKNDVSKLLSPIQVGKRRKLLTINGETKSLIEWCELYNKNKTTVLNRIKLYGYSPFDAVTKPVRRTT